MTQLQQQQQQQNATIHVNNKSTAGPQSWGSGNAGDDMTAYQAGYKYELPADGHRDSVATVAVPGALGSPRSMSSTVTTAAVSPSPGNVSPDHTAGGMGFYMSPQTTLTGTEYQTEGNNGHVGRFTELHG